MLTIHKQVSTSLENGVTKMEDLFEQMTELPGFLAFKAWLCRHGLRALSMEDVVYQSSEAGGDWVLQGASCDPSRDCLSSAIQDDNARLSGTFQHN
jgi:hypothetical protein